MISLPSYPTFLWKINFTLVRRLNSALIWDISGQWYHYSDGQDFREKRIVFSRFLSLYKWQIVQSKWLVSCNCKMAHSTKWKEGPKKAKKLSLFSLSLGTYSTNYQQKMSSNTIADIYFDFFWLPNTRWVVSSGIAAAP